MYIPKHHHWIFPTANVLLGFYFQHNFPGLDVVVFVQIPLVFVGCTHAWYILQAGIMYQAYITRMDAKPAHQEPKPAPRNVPNLSEYPQAVPFVRVDARRNFANIVLARIEHGYAKVDLTETYWLVRKPRKWLGKDEEFRAMMHEWEGDVVERKNPGNPRSSYIVRDVARLRDKAEGR